MGRNRFVRVSLFAFALCSGVFISASQASSAFDRFASTIAYFGGYKYTLDEGYLYHLSFDTKTTVVFGKIELDGDILKLRAGFGWDGASGPAIDTEDILRASAIHDALWELMKQGLLDQRYKKAIDSEFASILEEDGMPLFRRWYLLKAVSSYSSVSSLNERELSQKVMKSNAAARRFLQALSLNAQAVVLNKRTRDLMKRPFSISFKNQ